MQYNGNMVTSASTRFTALPLRLTDTHRRVYQLVRTQGPLSRADVVRITTLTFPTISRVIAEFVAVGVLEETKVRRGGMGKPPIDLVLAAEHAHSIGLACNGEELEGVLIDAVGVVQKRTKVSATSKPLAEAARAAVQNLQVDNARLVGLGITYETTPLGASELEALEQTLGLPVAANTRAGAGALLERYFGAAQAFNSFIYLDATRQLSSALLIGDRLFAQPFQLSSLVHVLESKLDLSSGDWNQQLPALTKALLAAEILIEPEALIVGADIADTKLDELTTSLRNNLPEGRNLSVVLRGFDDPDKLALAAATLPLHKLFSITSIV